MQTYFPQRQQQLGAKQIRRSSGLKVGEMSAALPNARAEPWLHNTNKPPGDARCSPWPGPDPTPVPLCRGRQDAALLACSHLPPCARCC